MAFLMPLSVHVFGTIDTYLATATNDAFSPLADGIAMWQLTRTVVIISLQ